jgi:ureidoglycolate lyase
MGTRLIHREPLTAEAYAPFGSVLAAGGVAPRVANQGRAKVWDHLAELVNLRGDARANVGVFRCAPETQRPVPLRVFERHRFSTQLFVPMRASRYLVVVAPGADVPDIDHAHAFEVTGAQAITYHPGTWHHPMIALDETADFVCIVYENRSPGDCELVPIDSATVVDLW